jgi:hypothetical protein
MLLSDLERHTLSERQVMASLLPHLKDSEPLPSPAEARAQLDAALTAEPTAEADDPYAEERRLLGV